MSWYHREEALRIWNQLGGEEGGKISIADIVKHSRYLERSFPELLQEYAKIAVRGTVSWDVFEPLYLGTPLPANSEPTQGERKLYSVASLRRLFDAIDEDKSGSINLQDVIAQQELVCEHFPEMLTKWSDIDTNDNGSISWDAFRHFFGDVDDWLEFQLGSVVGLEDLKSQIRRFYRGVMLDRARQKQGHNVGIGAAKFHMIFQGNPGTGKTSMARLMASLLHRVGIAPNDKLTEVQQEQLVAGFVGQTAPKTQKIIEESIGGLLFIDEAYRLSQGEKNEFGKEAIETLMGAMNSPPTKAPIMVFAGYTDSMQKFMSQNDGLYRRLPYTFTFGNYSCSELAEILEMMVAKNGFDLEQQLLLNGRQRLARIIETKTLQRTRELMNGGLCERIFTLAKQALDSRDSPDSPTVIFTVEDITSACQQIPPPPDPMNKHVSLEQNSQGDASDAIDGNEVRELRNLIRELQDQNAKLLKENAQFKRDASQSEMTLLPQYSPSGENRTLLSATDVAELRGIQEMMKEQRRLKAELDQRDEELRQMRELNEKLQDDLITARKRASHFAIGKQVQYYSGSAQKWIDAVVQGYDAVKDTYDLDKKKAVAPGKVREKLPQPIPIVPEVPVPPPRPKHMSFQNVVESEELQLRKPNQLSSLAADASEKERVAAQFHALDQNGDGFIDRLDLAKVLEKLDANAWPQERIGRLLSLLDGGGTESEPISYQKFLDWVFKANSALRVGRLDKTAQMEELRRLRPEEKAFCGVLRRMSI